MAAMLAVGLEQVERSIEEVQTSVEGSEGASSNGETV